MGLLEYIEQLRREPEAKRRRVAFWATAGLTLLIILVWFSTLRYTTFVASEVTSPAASSTTLGTNSGQGNQPGIWTRIKLGWQTIIK